MINWIYFPLSSKPPELVLEIVKVFNVEAKNIDSYFQDLKSNEVLAILYQGLLNLGFQVETGKRKDQKIFVPVLFGRNGKPEKSFEADAFNEDEGFVVEIEAGRGVLNNQFLKDLFQACMMHDVKYLAIAVRNRYKKSNDFDRVERFFETLYASSRLQLPLKGILIIGY